MEVVETECLLAQEVVDIILEGLPLLFLLLLIPCLHSSPHWLAHQHVKVLTSCCDGCLSSRCLLEGECLVKDWLSGPEERPQSH